MRIGYLQNREQQAYQYIVLLLWWRVSPNQTPVTSNKSITILPTNQPTFNSTIQLKLQYHADSKKNDPVGVFWDAQGEPKKKESGRINGRTNRYENKPNVDTE